MKKKQVLAVSSALMIGTTTALTGLPTPAMAQENTEVVQEAVVEENKTEQVPVEAELVGRRPAFREDDVRFTHLQQAIEINRGDGFRELRRI